jgi:hypothetical protein
MTSKTIADIEAGGNHISVWIKAEPDGGVRVDDSSYGPTANDFYGPGADIDHVLELDAAAVRKLYSALTDERHSEQPSTDLMELLSVRFAGKHDALRQIAGLCDQHGVAYKRDVWVSYDD